VKKGRIAIVLAVIAGALIWVLARGLGGNLVYYKTPTEILRSGQTLVGQRVRLGGLVLPGTVQTKGRDITFVVSDETTRMSVVDSGGVPSLFPGGTGRRGRGVLRAGWRVPCGHGSGQAQRQLHAARSGGDPNVGARDRGLDEQARDVRAESSA